MPGPLANLNSEDLDLIEDLLNHQLLVWQDAECQDDDMSGYAVAPTVAEARERIESIIGLLHGVEQ